MARQRRTEEAPATRANSRRKRTQRERIIAAMIAAANRRGYAGASVSTVIDGAGVSRPTFYDYFEDREDAFRGSIEDVQQDLLGALSEALAAAAKPPVETAIEVLLGYAAAQPARARFLMGESMAGGAGALDVRDRGVAQLAGAIEAAQRGAERAADIEARVLIGAVYRMIATRLRRGEARIAELADELRSWVGYYERPAAELSWQSLTPRRVPRRSPPVPSSPLQEMPSLIPPGRPRLHEGEIAENHRLRILYATARLAEEKGYIATKVSDIAALARIDGRAFYRLFADKQDAFGAVHELGFQQVMDVTGKAFFSASDWPMRSWEAGRALTQLLQANPLVAHVGFVEAYAVGPATVQRIEDSHTAFMFFLQEGLLYRPQQSPPSRVAMEAVISSVFEVIYLQARRPHRMQIAGMLPQIAHLWLTPFLGVEESDAFIEHQTRRGGPARARRKG
jgi:AcrR family transcriptional regulator